MEKLIITYFALIISFVGLGQNSEHVDLKGVFRATATISPSISLSNSFNNIYISGESEYYFESFLSLRGDLFVLAGTLEEKQDLYHHHHLMIGPQFHGQKGIVDFFGGFSMGLNLTSEKNYFPLPDIYNQRSLTPNFSINSGVNFYVFDYFHFFAHARYMMTTYRGHFSGNKRMDELIFSAGLGFQIPSKK